MKAKYIILLLVGTLALFSSATLPMGTVASHEKSIPNKEKRVYICGGKYAKKFHSHSKCRGLNNCKASIYYYDSVKEAQDAGYEYCRICWK